MTKPREIPGHVSVSHALRESLPDHSIRAFEPHAGKTTPAFTKAMAAQIEPPKPARFVHASRALPQADFPDPRPSFARNGDREQDWFIPFKPEPKTQKLSKEAFLRSRGHDETRDRPRRHSR